MLAALYKGQSCATAWQSRSTLLDSQEMLATLILFLGLPLALAAEPQSCAPLVPVTFDNTTIPQVSPALIQTPNLSFPVSIPALMDMGGGYGSSVFI